AEAATPGPWEYQAPLKVLAADRTWIVLIALSHANCREDKANSRFIAANNPKTVLALLDEIDGLSDELSACTEHPGGCGYWREAAKRRAEERDQFKEENEALRESLQALIHISDATGWEDHTCGEIAKARAALEGAKP
ncbi:TPA: ead/Ea22-like family protein, partial [Pseudomonas aeruginosa]|nr:ead/Ea22-like family protein [Pseudomonas aeruginosa]HBN9189819.1 ead/Ea22-like family protein [Pseudomonas aeruginosa]HBN9290626.1 ead/Ea22-like family protein [Pseudomonas aeruginosa]HBO3893054.1 ead/Ea22-like family protein [Pseudomonas aeruginosa]HCR1312444.1 ead/Ea22-like family protein [Pseudomonas aeruginosa]